MASVAEQVDPLFLAQSRLRRRRYDECIDICTRLLSENPYDRAAWYLKTRAITLKNWLDDTEMEEEGVAELLMDENSTAQAPRPGTSFSGTRPGAGVNQSVRPVSSSGRPLTGFARPGTSSARPTTGMTLDQAFRGGGRPGTSRPLTSLGRQLRLGTASMLSDASTFIVVDKLDLRKYAQRPSLSRALCDYLLYVERLPAKALELAAHATVAERYQDWWWKARLGKCYYQLGLLRDAEKQYKSALRDQPMVATTLELAKVYTRLDQPNTALDWMQRACEHHPADVRLLLGMGRVHDALGNTERAVEQYKKVLQLDASNVEAIACLASNHFYTDQPEVALRFYRRLLQLGVRSTELWNNVGLCCFYAGQYDMALSCFERALEAADDNNMADVWYNLGQVAIGIGDLGLAYQVLKVAVAVDGVHAESLTNLGVLELRRGNIEQARSQFRAAQRAAEHMFEPWYNGALLSFKLGELQDSFDQVSKALELYPEHSESQDLMKQLRKHFTMA